MRLNAWSWEESKATKYQPKSDYTKKRGNNKYFELSILTEISKKEPETIKRVERLFFFWWSPQEIIGFAFLVLLTFKILWQMTKRITYEWLCWFYYYKYLLVFLIRLRKHRHVMVGKTIDLFFLQIFSPQNDLIIHRYGDEWNR